MLNPLQAGSPGDSPLTPWMPIPKYNIGISFSWNKVYKFSFHLPFLGRLQLRVIHQQQGLHIDSWIRFFLNDFFHTKWNIQYQIHVAQKNISQGPPAPPWAGTAAGRSTADTAGET